MERVTAEAIIDRVLASPEDATVAGQVRAEVRELAARFPLYERVAV